MCWSMLIIEEIRTTKMQCCLYYCFRDITYLCLSIQVVCFSNLSTLFTLVGKRDVAMPFYTQYADRGRNVAVSSASRPPQYPLTIATVQSRWRDVPAIVEILYCNVVNAWRPATYHHSVYLDVEIFWTTDHCNPRRKQNANKSEIRGSWKSNVKKNVLTYHSDRGIEASPMPFPQKCNQYSIHPPRYCTDWHPITIRVLGTTRWRLQRCTDHWESPTIAPNQNRPTWRAVHRPILTSYAVSSRDVRYDTCDNSRPRQWSAEGNYGPWATVNQPDPICRRSFGIDPCTFSNHGPHIRIPSIIHRDWLGWCQITWPESDINEIYSQPWDRDNMRVSVHATNGLWRDPSMPTKRTEYKEYVRHWDDPILATMIFHVWHCTVHPPRVSNRQRGYVWSQQCHSCLPCDLCIPGCCMKVIQRAQHKMYRYEKIINRVRRTNTKGNKRCEANANVRVVFEFHVQFHRLLDQSFPF